MSNPIKSISVFCGSSTGTGKAYSQSASNLGDFLAKNGIRLIYGASNLGLMGAVSQSALENGGEVIGIMPKIFDGRVQHPNLNELIITETMHQRKAKMYELSDAFIALPGGLGTFEELLEVITWSQIGYHSKPIGILNVNGYYDPLLALLKKGVEERFIRSQHQQMLKVSDKIPDLFTQLNEFEVPKIDKWLA